MWIRYALMIIGAFAVGYFLAFMFHRGWKLFAKRFKRWIRSLFPATGGMVPHPPFHYNCRSALVPTFGIGHPSRVGISITPKSELPRPKWGDSPCKEFYDMWKFNQYHNKAYRTFINAEFTGRNEEAMRPDTAQEWMDKHGLKVGDDVRVYRPDREWGLWRPEMDSMVGKVYTIGGCSVTATDCIILNCGYSFRILCLEPLPKPAPTYTLDTDAIRKRFSEAVVVGNRANENEDVKTTILVPTGWEIPGQWFDLIHGGLFRTLNNCDWIIRPGDKCDASNNTLFSDQEFAGFSGDMDHPFLIKDRKYGNKRSHIRPLPQITAEQKERRARIEKIEKEMEQGIGYISDVTESLEHLANELKRLKQMDK